jgi:hypothetical protein
LLLLLHFKQSLTVEFALTVQVFPPGIVPFKPDAMSSSSMSSSSSKGTSSNFENPPPSPPPSSLDLWSQIVAEENQHYDNQIDIVFRRRKPRNDPNNVNSLVTRASSLFLFYFILF